MIPLLLAGPAGSGKTHRCLAEIAARLRKNQVGAPLILLAPRQATYQLERQILALDGIDGFSRLRILSFQRLAQFVFDSTGRVPPKMLDEQGRVMALRAILARRRDQLRLYKNCAQRDGLAQELSELWRELCEHRAGPVTLRETASKLQNPRLRAKLEDFADIFDDYQNWLEDHSLRDGDELLDLAAEAALKGPLPMIEGLWLDGFAQMTPQERRLLNAILPKCAEATLAFCLPERPIAPGDAFEMWSVVARAYCQVRTETQMLFGAPPSEETLSRRTTAGRFDRAPMLAFLEERWGRLGSYDGACADEQVRVVKCANFEAEVIFTAREILKFARGGGRFREAAVLLRSLDGAHATLQRIFHRYGIPFFIDQRAPVAHHPLAELTRGALRTITFGFQHYDLFGALKSGLVGIAENNIDWFENMSLARGWRGEDWRQKLFCGPSPLEDDCARAETIRKAALQPIFKLQGALGISPSGSQMAKALKGFWMDLDVETQLEQWAETAHEALHTTVWTQMEDWLTSVQVAFGNEKMSLVEWLEIVEAGLGSLTVGLIPPALDQVLIGAVDRSRNPDLRAVFLLGVNEGIFPKPGKERLLLSDRERETLAETGVQLGVTSVWNLGAEQFYGYIACTRGRESLTVTYSQTGDDGEPLNPSLFISKLRRLFPGLKEQAFDGVPPAEALVAHELNPIVFAAARNGGIEIEKRLGDWPLLQSAWERARSALITDLPALSPASIGGLYGARLRTSVSKLEQFAMCPFRFFVASGLGAEERLVFELDRREEGSLQHEILAEFHRHVKAAQKRWRDISPQEGRELIAQIGREMKTKFQNGLVEATPSNRFRAQAKIAALQDFIEIYLELLRDCDFDTEHVELAFGPKGPLPVWVLSIDDKRAIEFMGRIDRVDVWVDKASKQCHALVFDYKSSKRDLNRKLVDAAIQQQLPAYLAALQNMGGTAEFPHPVRPAGAFYVNLNLGVKSASTRAEAMAPDDAELRADLAQSGVFDWGVIDRLDAKRTGALFDYNTAGPKRYVNFKALETAEFSALLKETEDRLRALGKRIFDGDLRIDPYRKGHETPCDRCFYFGICRIDPWTHPFRKL